MIVQCATVICRIIQGMFRISKARRLAEERRRYSLREYGSVLKRLSWIVLRVFSRLK